MEWERCNRRLPTCVRFPAEACRTDSNPRLCFAHVTNKDAVDRPSLSTAPEPQCIGDERDIAAAPREGIGNGSFQETDDASSDSFVRRAIADIVLACGIADGGLASQKVKDLRRGDAAPTLWSRFSRSQSACRTARWTSIAAVSVTV